MPFKYQQFTHCVPVCGVQQSEQAHGFFDGLSMIFQCVYTIAYQCRNCNVGIRHTSEWPHTARSTSCRWESETEARPSYPIQTQRGASARCEEGLDFFWRPVVCERHNSCRICPLCYQVDRADMACREYALERGQSISRYLPKRSSTNCSLQPPNH